MDNALAWLARLFTDTPYIYLSWPGVAMIVGWLIALCSKQAAQSLAIVPRTAGGLVGLITAPFIHANFGHLAANLPPFLVLGALVAPLRFAIGPRSVARIATRTRALISSLRPLRSTAGTSVKRGQKNPALPPVDWFCLTVRQTSCHYFATG